MKPIVTRIDNIQIITIARRDHQQATMHASSKPHVASLSLPYWEPIP
jgi:hypothetical protein